MTTIRLAVEEDAERITEMRRKMFEETVVVSEAHMENISRSFTPWVRERLRDGRYIGWFACEGDEVLAGAGMLLMDFPPHWLDPQALRAYLLNFYVEHAARNRGLAYALLKTSIEEARRRGIKIVTLHASKFGKPLYERNGFEATNEMMLKLAGSESR